MKKYLAVLFGVIFLLSFTVTAFAIHEEMPAPVDQAVVAQGPAKITLGGKIIVRGWYFDNVVGNNVSDGGGSPTSFKSQSLYTTNAYLTIDARISDNVRGYMELETSNNDGNNSGVLYWGVGKPGSPQGTYDTKPNGDFRFRQVWLQYTGSGLLGVPTGIKAGHMPIALGEKIFLNNERFGDDAILVWADPMKELHLVIGTVKLVESSNVNIGFIDHTQDLNGYVLVGTYMLDKDNTIGANLTWAHTDGNIPSLPSSPSGNCDKMDMYNAELHGNGKIYGFTWAFEGDIQFGKAKNVLGIEDKDFEGWGVMAKLGYMLDPVNIRAMFAYGSGDDDAHGNISEFQTLQGTDATGAIARLTHYTLIYERLVRTTAAEAVVTTFPGGNVRTTGIANTMVGNLGFDIKPAKQLNVSLDGFYLEAAKTGAWEDLTGTSVSKKAGWELDLKTNYEIAKNLSYFFEAGAFFAGDFYKDTNSLFIDTSSKRTTAMAVHGLLLNF